MCTLTVLRQSDGIRLHMNRDERHSRVAELSPRIIDSSNGIFGPLDPEGGGTWIAHNDQGYWGCLLNGYLEKDVVKLQIKDLSRGAILTTLLAEADPIEAAGQFDPTRFQSFRLVVGDASKFVLWAWDGHEYYQDAFQAHVNDTAYFLTSSSWEPEKVIQIRAELFSSWAEGLGDALESFVGVPEFHSSSLPQPSSAPLMFRPHSCTKSITSLWVQDRQCQMDYQTVSSQAVACQ